MIKPLILEIYTLKHKDHLVEEIKKGRYDIRTNSGAVILPSVWTALVQPFTTIKISFWTDSTTDTLFSPLGPRDARQ
jgi:hypothetical protein